ncbi:hypothetical protein PseBG33_1326 [Pseudomonas synxantha BG33R]|uniref:hypothetical protein n=1 Tax=Pseudomonas synxantha TaxID=47883 RepID=UPI00025FF1B0|nr:hypothetical protein [Pseudomonas synxantha]EIK67544.1 hypothetical protein PseBG33_1326 [Pseudomonas synxantha BG33R]
MSEVERYWIDPSRLVQEGWHQDDTCVAKDWAYDRVVAERDALQQRLTAADERNDEAIDLLRRARAVIEGGGWADLERDIAKFFKPAEGKTPSIPPERERLMEIVQEYPNVDPLEYDAAVRILRK